MSVDVWFLRIREPDKRSTVAAAPSDFHGDSFVRKARLDGVSNQCPRVVWWNAGYFNQVRLGIARFKLRTFIGFSIAFYVLRNCIGSCIACFELSGHVLVLVSPVLNYGHVLDLVLLVSA